MSLTLRFLGTSAARPTVERNVSSLALIREGETMLFDCGEGTQRQMMRYGISFVLEDIFFTHLHADHVIGVIGLMRTMALQGRTEALRLWGPRGSSRHLRRASEFGVERVGFRLDVMEVHAGETIKRNGYAIEPFAADHGGGPSLGFALVEEERRGRFNPDLAREMGVPEGPLWGRLHRGEAVTLPDGRVVDPVVLVGPRRSGRKVVISGDTRPAQTVIDASAHADVLVHEATFADEEADRARETGHSTAREAAAVARGAAVRQLVLTHFSARYSRDASELLRQAREEFDAVVLARDGLEIEVPYQDEAVSEAADREGSRRG
ncbi:MAG TPA: ribonuclease Z [Gemmatimonadaceae bacterium]|jgi:ribonuclease Z